MPTRTRLDRLAQNRHAVTPMELLFQTKAEMITDLVRGADRQALLLKCVVAPLGGIGDDTLKPREGLPPFAHVVRRL